MRWLQLALLNSLVLTLGQFAPATSAWGHGVPILLSATPDGKIHTDKLVYSSGLFENLSGDYLETDQPGYSVVNQNQGISSGTLIQINVVDQLLFWQNGVVKLDSKQNLEIDNPLGGFTFVNKDTVFVPSFPVETFSSTGGVWHEHLTYILLDTAAPVGAYGLLLQVTAPGYQKSDNILVVLNNGLSSGTLSLAAAALAEAEFQEPGDANSDGIVDGADYTIWADHYLQTVTWRYGNFNFDGIVDGADYTVWADNYAPASLAAAAVPEPATLVSALVGAGLLAVAASRRRRPPTP